MIFRKKNPPSRPGSPPAVVDWSDIEMVRREWPTNGMDPAVDLEAWRVGQQLYAANDDYHSMIRAAELMCQALRHHLYGPGLLKGQDLPPTVHSVLYAACTPPPGTPTLTEQASKQLRLALTICRENGWQPKYLGGDGAMDRAFAQNREFLFGSAIAPPGEAVASLESFFGTTSKITPPFTESPAGSSASQSYPETAARSSTQFDPEGPELALEEAMDAAARRPQDWATAFERCVKAVDRLHDFYVFERFRNRQPSTADEPIVNALTQSLRYLRSQQPRLDVSDGVKEATHRLRTISTAADGAGLDSSLYRQGLQLLAQAAPDVDVSNVLWY
jgi:hypothetical protein